MVGSQEILINIGRDKMKIQIDDISYIESRGHHVFIHIVSQKDPLRVYESLRHFEKILPEKLFVKCNNCYLVNLRKIKSVSGYECMVYIGDGLITTLQISQPKRRSFQERFVRFLEGDTT